MTAKNARPALPISSLRPMVIPKRRYRLATMKLEIARRQRAYTLLSRAIAARVFDGDFNRRGHSQGSEPLVQRSRNQSLRPICAMISRNRGSRYNRGTR